MKRLNVSLLQEYRKQVADTYPETTDDIITGMTARIANWTPLARVEPLVRAWVTAEVSSQIVPHLAALAYADGSSRLDAALIYAIQGFVTETAPADWTIKSQSHYETYYHINGVDCDCEDTAAPIIAGHKACKHQLAVWLVRKAGPLPTDTRPLALTQNAAFGETLALQQAALAYRDQHEHARYARRMVAL